MEAIISLKELRQDVSKYAKQVERGKTFVVVKRSQPLFRISPVEEEGWETVIDFTSFQKGGIPADALVKRLKAMKK
jgi:prevent-host-death family protein